MATIKKSTIKKSTIKKSTVKKSTVKKPIKKAQDGMDFNPASGMSFKPGEEAHIGDIKSKVRQDMHNPLYEERDLAYRKAFNGPQPSTNTPISKEETPFYKKIDASDKAKRAKAVENIAVRTRDLEGVPRILKGRNSEGNIERNGGKVMKKKMKNGGSLTGLKASNKRVGPVDPKGAYTKVQKKTLAGAKGKASLTKDKQLGATKMKAKCGTCMSKKK
ncbi:MAG: hypothetical protein JHC33_03525 [Ignisphaera sp.]|nr:hypothetical protein [Ignisphaera sp.]